MTNTRTTYFYSKLVFDEVAALTLLIITSPLLVLICMLLFFSGSPVFFVQQRAGLHGKVFSILKFRTMKDGRVTKIGQILRRTSLDELPQLINVIKRDMSLVGPRPLLTEYNLRYSEQHLRRLDVLPGITGLAQVEGRNALTWSQRFDLDLTYVEQASFWLDVTILVKTIRVVWSGGGTEPMEPFEGY